MNDDRRTCENCNYIHVDMIDYPCNVCNTITNDKWEKYDPEFWLNNEDGLREEKLMSINELDHAVHKLKRLNVSKEKIIELVNDAFK